MTHSTLSSSTRLITLLAACVALAACGDDSTDSSSTSTSSTSNTTFTNADAGHEDDAHSDDSGNADTGTEPTPSVWEQNGCDLGVSWSDGPALPGPARDHHVTFITTQGSPKLHVVGGQDYDETYSDHWISDIAEDGSLGSWREGVSLPSTQAGQSIAQVGDNVYLFTGLDDFALTRATYRARFDANGEITAWDELDRFPAGRFHSNATVWGNHIYVTGGLAGQSEAQDTLFHSTVQDDGSLSAWTEVTLPIPMTHHTSFTHDQHLFLALGFTGTLDSTENIKALYKAPILDDGTLGDFEEIALDLENVTLAGTVVGDCAYLFGGLNTTNRFSPWNDAVVRINLTTGAITEDDALLPWSTGRSHTHQVPRHNGFFYTVAGSYGNRQVGTNVEIGTLTLPE